MKGREGLQFVAHGIYGEGQTDTTPTDCDKERKRAGMLASKLARVEVTGGGAALEKEQKLEEGQH